MAERVACCMNKHNIIFQTINNAQTTTTTTTTAAAEQAQQQLHSLYSTLVTARFLYGHTSTRAQFSTLLSCARNGDMLAVLYEVLSGADNNTATTTMGALEQASVLWCRHEPALMFVYCCCC